MNKVCRHQGFYSRFWASVAPELGGWSRFALAVLVAHVIVRRLQRRSKSDKCSNQNALLFSGGSRSLRCRMKSNKPFCFKFNPNQTYLNKLIKVWRVTRNLQAGEFYAAFTCYRNYRKYEVPNRKLDVNASQVVFTTGKFRNNFDTRVSELGGS